MRILILLGLSVLDLGPIFATDRQTDVRRTSSLNAPTLGAGIIRQIDAMCYRNTSIYASGKLRDAQRVVSTALPRPCPLG